MRPLHYLVAVGLICVALSAAGLLQQYLGVSVARSGNPALEALLAVYASTTPTFEAQVRASGCQVDGALPDHDCSPGAVFADATVEQICTPGYSAGVRSVSVSLKKKIYAAYDISYPQATGSYELDHLVPLELGGDNDASNLFPESADPAPGFHEKDLVEDYLHQQVCAGTISLSAAQKQIANNWLAVYQTLTPDVIAQLKQQFRSWAD